MSRGHWSLRALFVVLTSVLLLASGPLSAISDAYAATPPVRQASSQTANPNGKPNKPDSHAQATSSTRAPQTGAPPAPNTPVPPAQKLINKTPPPMQPGSLSLSANGSAHFLGSDGLVEVDIPAGAVTDADLKSAGGGHLTVQITQIAPGGGSTAGGSGLISFGTYLIQVVDGNGVLAKQGLRKAANVKLHVNGGKKRNSALDLSNAFVVVNGSLPEGTQVAPLALTPATPQHGQVLGGGQPEAVYPALNDRAALGIGSLQHAKPTLDASTNTLSVPLTAGTPSTSMSWNTHSPVAAFGNPDPFNVDLNAGGLTGSFPIDLPPAPGGTLPPVQLSYGSAGVNENHSPQAAASWVGEGWNLSLGSITWSEHNVTSNCVSTCGNTWQSSWQLSDPFGSGSELIPDDFRISTFYDDTPYDYCVVVNSNCTYPGWPKTTWRTADGAYAKIVSYVGPNTLATMKPNPPCFRAWLTNGVMEEFGCTPDSVQFYYEPGNGDHVTGWLLDLITDPEGNQIHFVYQQDQQVNSGITYTRDVVLSRIEYDDPTCRDAQNACVAANWHPLVQVVFNANHTPARLTGAPPTGCNTGTNLRCDDPFDLTGSSGLAAPQVQSTFVLNDVQAQVRSSGTGAWNMLKKYELSYDQTGPTTPATPDPSTGKTWSTAGRLLLTKLRELGTDSATAMPTRTFGYANVTQYYTDSAYFPNPNTNCGPAWNTGTGSGCLLWNKSFEGNSYYLSSVDNGMGLHQTYSWANARNNTHGVNGGGTNTANALYCNGLTAAQQATYPCNAADDQEWSRVILTSQDEQHYRAASSGNVLVDSLTNYGFTLTYPLIAQQCSDCSAGFYWGNQNDGDYLDYYNSKFMGFSQATVFNADGSKDVHKYLSTEGYGVYDTTQVGCFAAHPPCHNAPWWHLGNAGHGHETETDSYATDGATLLHQTQTQYQAVCPPSGVSGSPTFPAYPTSPGWGNWNGNRVSGLDHNSPVAVCAVRATQSDDFTMDGATDPFAVPHKSVSMAYDSLGRVSDQTSGVDTGLKAQYYNVKDLTGLTFTRLDATVNNNWGVNSPDPAIGVDNFSVRWTGYVQPKYSETYTFYTMSDDGVRLWVNGTQLVNNWTDHGPTENSGAIALTGGQRYAITMEYYENTGGATATLSWSSASTPKQIIPASALYTRADGGGGKALGSPSATVAHTDYIQNDAVSATLTSATGRYLLDFPANSYTGDGANTVHYSCSQTSYDGAAYATGQQGSLVLGEATTSDTYTGCGTSGNSFALTGQLRTSTSYDSYGNSVASKDADANAGVAGHVGCTVSSVQYTACSAVDSTYKTLPVSSSNALNQTSTTGYTSTAAGGFGFWETSTTDFNSQITTNAYDPLGRMTSATLPGETGGQTTKSWAYTVWCSDTGAQAPCVELDEIQRLDSSTTVTSRAFYDGYGRLVETRKAGPAGSDVVNYAFYDTSNNLYFESNSYLVSAYTGAPGAAAFATPDVSQVGTSKTRDALNRVTSVTDPVSNTTQMGFTVGCSVASGDTACYEQTAITDPLSHKRLTSSDAQGRQAYDLRYTGNSGGTYALYTTTKYAYDANGNLTQITHPNGTTTTTFTFDAASRKTAQSDPDRGSETYGYDANGNLTQGVDARGANGTIYAGYDGLDRLLWRNTVNSPTGARVAYTYDSTAGGNPGVGRLTSETFTGGAGSPLSGAYSYLFDARGQNTSTTTTVNGTPYTVSQTYDDAGDALTQTYPTGEVVTTSYTGTGWLGSVSRLLSGTTTTLANTILYTGTGGAAGKITSMRLGNNTYGYAAAYDNAHRLTSGALTRVSDSATLFATAPTFDAANNVVGVATTLPAGTDNQAFCYDEQNRLTWAGSTGAPSCGAPLTAGSLTAANYTQTFSYDTLGRLTSGPLGAYTYGDGAHTHAATSIGSTYTASYDASGNMTCRAPTNATTCTGTPTGAQLTFDAEGWLKAWQDKPTNPTSTASYLYDGNGQRIAQQTSSGGATTTTAYVGNVEEVATTGGTTTTTTYYYAGGMRIAVGVNGTLSYLAGDLLDSATVAFDGSGNATASLLYAPYGAARYTNGTMPGTFGFTGQRLDAATGLNYYGFRYYDATAGQFVSTDSTLSQNGYTPWGLSRYAYVQGNPETLTDPDGHCWPWCTMAIGAVVGAAIGAGISIGTQVASGHSVDWGQVGKEAAVGAVSGAIAGLAGPVGGPMSGVLAHVLIGAASGAGGQLVSNALNNKPLGDGVLLAAGVGALTGGIEGGIGRLVAKGANGASKGLQRVVSGGCSFSSDTPIATPSGERPIGQIQEGDSVIAYDPATGKTSAQAVEHVWINHDNDLLDITLGTVAIPASNISDSSATTLKDAPSQDKPAPTGKGKTEHTRDDSANSQGQNSIHVGGVHSQETIHTTSRHPWLTADRGWVEAGDLHVGEYVMRTDGMMVAVQSMHVIPGVGTMYNLTVANIHTFAVGDDRYIVHNTGKACELFERWTSTESADAGAAAGKLFGRGKGDKWISEVGKYSKPRDLGGAVSKHNGIMTIVTKPGTRAWLRDSANAVMKGNEPGNYGILSGRLNEFNSRILKIYSTSYDSVARNSSWRQNLQRNISKMFGRILRN